MSNLYANKLLHYLCAWRSTNPIATNSSRTAEQCVNDALAMFSSLPTVVRILLLLFPAKREEKRQAGSNLATTELLN